MKIETKNGTPNRQARQPRKFSDRLRARLPRTNNPEMKKHAGHKETVIEQHDVIEAEPAHPVAMAKVGVVDDRVVRHHQQRDDGTRGRALRCAPAPSPPDQFLLVSAALMLFRFWQLQSVLEQAVEVYFKASGGYHDAIA
jgi:hypothetical protein